MADLFVASAGASAALAGDPDLQGLPERGLVTLPDGPGRGGAGRRHRHHRGRRHADAEVALERRGAVHFTSSLGVSAIGTLPFIVAGVSPLAEAGGGLRWVLAGFVCAIVGSMLNAWVLLVEILR